MVIPPTGRPRRRPGSFAGRKGVPPKPVCPGCCRRATCPGPERASRAGWASAAADAACSGGSRALRSKARRHPARGAPSAAPRAPARRWRLAVRRSPAAAGRGTAAGSAAAAAPRAAWAGTTGRASTRPEWWCRRPPKPQTSASHVPASAATCRPSDESCSASRMSASADSTMYWCARSGSPTSAAMIAWQHAESDESLTVISS